MKTILITGVTGSIGKATAAYLASQDGLHIILAGRNPEKLRAIQDALPKDKSKTEILELDLGEIKSIRTALDRITTSHPRLDALVNIAAVYKSTKTFTTEGFETMFATNHLGPFLLTTGLLPVITKTQGGKVITVSAPSSTKVDFHNLNGERSFSSLTAFGASKMMNLLFSFRLARQFANSGNASMAFHPGLVKSDLLKEGPAALRFFLGLISSSPEKTGRGLATLVLNGDAAQQNGKFFNKSGKTMKAAAFAHDESVQEILWKKSEELINS